MKTKNGTYYTLEVTKECGHYSDYEQALNAGRKILNDPNTSVVSFMIFEHEYTDQMDIENWEEI